MNSMMARFVGLVIALSLSVMLTAESCANTTATKSAPSAAPQTANQVKIGSLLLTVNGVQNTTDDLFPAEAGTHYVALDVTARNVGDKTYDLNRLNFALKDSDGYANNPAETETPSPTLTYYSMVPGQEVRAFLVFKIGDGRTPAELQYHSFTGTPGVIALQ